MAATPSFIAAAKNLAVSFANADGTGFKSLGAVGALGGRIDSIVGVNSDNANAYVVQLAVQISGVDYELGEVTIPIGAGTNGATKSVAVLNPTDIPALAYTENNALFLQNAAILRARVKSAVAGANTVKLVGVGGDY